MTVRHLAAEPLTNFKAELGEGPLWDDKTGSVIWVDIPGCAILTTDPATGHTDSISTPSLVGAVALVDSGGFLAALHDGVYLGDGTGPWRQIAEIESSDPETRMNDGKCDPRGSFVGGTMAKPTSPAAGGLYRVNSHGRTEKLLDGVSTSNGLDWTDDGRTMYFIDTPTRTVMAYPYDHAAPTLGPPTLVVEIAERHGFPDGMTLDTDGCLWVALWGGHAVHRYTPSGDLDTIIDVPVRNVTSCAFGGDNLDTLFITTAAPGLKDKGLADEPFTGALFAVQMDVSGRSPKLFRGATN